MPPVSNKITEFPGLPETPEAVVARERKQSQRLLDEAEKMFAEASRKSELAIKERDEFKQKHDLALQNLALTQKALAEARQDLSSPRKKGDAGLVAQIDAIRAARDGMADQITQLNQRIATLEDELADACYARDTAEKSAVKGKDASDLKKRLAAAEEKNAIFSENEARLTSEVSAMRGEIELSLQGSTADSGVLDEAREALATAQRQLQETVQERDELRAQLEQNAGALDAKACEQAKEIERLTQTLTSKEDRFSDQHEMVSHFEQRRLDMIELNTKLENAHREIRNLSASLAEARLHAKLSGKPLPSSSAGTKSPALQLETVAAMRRSFQAFSRDQKQVGLVGELETQSRTIADRATHEGHSILHSVGTAFASLLADLLEVPSQITQSTLRTMNQSIEFISLLLSDPEIEKSVHLNEVRAFVVDDDENTALTAVEALHLVGIQAVHTESASAAICELASTPYDLILLDVHMPDLDGFELAAQIRNMAPHAETPIFFVTGDTSLENRVKSSLRGAIEFIAKPFSVQELALKSLKSVITGQLRHR